MATFPPQFEVILTNASGEQLAIPYQLLDTPASSLWLDSVKKAIVSSKVRETRLYNFPSKTGDSLESLLKKFHETVEKLSKEFPELLEKNIDESDLHHLQASMNDLHRNFAHNHLVEMRVTQENFQIWHEFNALIHCIESELINLRYPIGPNQVRRMRIEFEWEIPYEKNIPTECFKEFTLEQEFGDVNVIYCDVGRHLYELYHARDIQDIPIEHIRPHRHFSANTGLNFGQKLDSEWANNETRKVHKWFMQHQEKFNRAGVFWDNADKALGFVKVAQMLNTPQGLEARRNYQSIVAKFDQVKEVKILE